MATPHTEVSRARPGSKNIGGAVPRFSWKTALAVIAVLGVTGWSAAGTGFNVFAMFSNAGAVGRFASEMFPPDFSAATLRATLRGVVETFQMSFLGALIGAVVAFPLAALGTPGDRPGRHHPRPARRPRGPLPPRPVSHPTYSAPSPTSSGRWYSSWRSGSARFPGRSRSRSTGGRARQLYSETLEAVPPAPGGAPRSAGAGISGISSAGCRRL